MLKLIEKANILNEALPYIKEFAGKIMVIKYGGSAMIDQSLKKNVIENIILMKYVGIHPVIVHGGGNAINNILKRIGKKSIFLDGLRVTDSDTMNITEMVLTGHVNKEIVSLLNLNGTKAVGISGKDANLIEAVKLKSEKLKDYGFVGKIKKINPEILSVLHKEGFIPVISPIAFSKNGETFNINADNVAGEIAGALKAYKLILLTDIKGVFKNKQDSKSLITTLTLKEMLEFKKKEIFSDGMLPKIESCIRAFEMGVHKIHIIDGRLANSILLELFTEGGIGTQIIKSRDYS